MKFLLSGLNIKPRRHISWSEVQKIKKNSCNILGHKIKNISKGLERNGTLKMNFRHCYSVKFILKTL